MWKVSGRSSALNRAEALLSGKRSSTRDGGGSTHDSTTKTQGASFRAGPVPPNSHNLFSDLSDLSSDTSASKQTAESPRLANTQENLEIKGDSTQDLRPQKSLAEGSRFLKKAPKPANSSHSPVSRNRAQAVVQPRCVSSSQGGSQAPALRRLAEIESRVRSRKQELEQAKKASAAVLSPASDVEMAPEAAVQIKEASAALSAQFDTDQSQRENRFLKKKNRSSSAPPEATRHAAAGVGFRSRAGDAVELSGGLERKPRRPMSGVSLGSDEEDMRKLLGDSVESISMSGPGRSSSVKRPDRTLSSPSEEDAHPSPPSPSCHSSPFRFTGQARAQFSPSALSPSPPSPHRPSTTPERQGSTQKAEGPRRCHSSASSHAEVLSLEELFPVGLGSEHPHSHISSASSEGDPGEIRVNVMTLDELIPCETPERQSSLDYQKTHFADLVLVPMQNQNKMADAVPGSQSRRQLSPWEEEEEAVVDYHSNFDTDSSARQISEYLGGGYDEEAEVRSDIRSEVRSDVRSEVRSDVRSEVRSKVRSKVTQAVSRTDESLRKTEDDYSSTFSSVRSESFSRSRRSFSQHSRRHASVRRSFKDAAAQTWPDPPGYSWSAGMAPLDPMVGRIYMGPTLVAPHAFSADRLEAVSMLDPAGFALNEMLKQQLAITKQFIERSEHLHACLMQSLEPPNYRYTTLEETMRSICRRRRPKPHREKT